MVFNKAITLQELLSFPNKSPKSLLGLHKFNLAKNFFAFNANHNETERSSDKFTKLNSDCLWFF